MMQGMPEPSSNDQDLLYLLLPLDVPLNQLINAETHFLRLAQSVATEFSTDPNAVTWVFDHFREGSLDLAVRAQPRLDEPAAIDIARIVDAVASGVRLIEQEATRPPFFTDAALQHAKDLALLDGVRVQNGRVGSALTDKLRRHVDEVFGQELEEIGTVEGKIESLTVHGRRVFNLYEPISGDKIECHFGYRIPSEEIGRAVEKRVAVHGIITYRSGQIARMKAQTLEVFPALEDLPTADEVFGILAD